MHGDRAGRAMSRWLLTRPMADSRSLQAELRARGHQSVVAPVLEIAFRNQQPPRLDGVQALLFTSQNGVRAFAAASRSREMRVFTVGRSTADAAIAAGFGPVESADGDSTALATLVAARLAPEDGALLHIAGTKVAGDLGGSLEGAGFTVRRSVLYEARPVDCLPETAATALRGGKVAGALFFSPRTAEVFARLVAAAGLTSRLHGLAALCLSNAVAERLGDGRWGTVRIAERPELPALLALLDTIDDPPARHATNH